MSTPFQELAALDSKIAAEHAEIKARDKTETAVLKAWNSATDAPGERLLMEYNCELHDEAETESAEVAALRAERRQLRDYAKEHELDDFVGTQLERELETGVDEA